MRAPKNGKLDPIATALSRQLRACKGVQARLRKENNRLRQEVAQARLRAPMTDLLLVITRQNNAIMESLLELADRRDKEQIVVEHQSSPYIKE